MALTITYNHPHFPTGANFDVRGLGVILNKTAHVMTAAEETAFTAFQHRKAEVAGTGDAQFVITGTPLT